MPAAYHLFFACGITKWCLRYSIMCYDIVHN